MLVPLPLQAQQQGKVLRVGILGSFTGNDPLTSRYWGAVKDGLRDLGYVAGQNLIFEPRSTEGTAERLPAVAAQLAALNVDVIITGNTPSTLAVKRATSTIPIVFATPADPVGSGLVASLSRPGGNVTGFSGFTAELVGKCFELLKETVPGITRIAVLRNPGAFGERTEHDMSHQAEVAARALGVRVHFVDVRGAEDFDRAFAVITSAHADAFYPFPSAVFNNQRTKLVALTAKHRLPAVYGFREFVDAGGLISYGPDYVDLFRRTGSYVDKIFKGARAGELPVQQPTKFELVINLKAAKALGLTIPPSLLLRADQIVE